MGEVGIRIQEAETEGEILTGGFRKGKNNDKDAGLYKKASFFIGRDINSAYRIPPGINVCKCQS